ncbi:hypothetical protein D0Z07_9275 [Hyphodiscus hymeniophilus]|uniref:Cytochrome b5 heme-binding domain-containing protein n=1 Tax=Hyphodiscus hymeniophilus TaxID=353542 RepID=A0A9P6VC56_9HELO|nr:hypothetical protein D0Z07_9275 [Hyphodiscus hymeniophilus]
MAGKFEPKEPVQLDPPKNDPISQEFLAKCNGVDSEFCYVAIKGKVFDVTGKGPYLKGGSYHGSSAPLPAPEERNNADMRSAGSIHGQGCLAGSGPHVYEGRGRATRLAGSGREGEEDAGGLADLFLQAVQYRGRGGGRYEYGIGSQNCITLQPQMSVLCWNVRADDLRR